MQPLSEQIFKLMLSFYFENTARKHLVVVVEKDSLLTPRRPVTEKRAGLRPVSSLQKPLNLAEDSLWEGRRGVFDVLEDRNVKLKGSGVSGLPVNVLPSPTSSSLLRWTSDRHPDESAFILLKKR